MIDGVMQINFNGRWYVMSEIGLEPMHEGDFEEKVEDGIVFIKCDGHWYPEREAVLNYFPFADLTDDDFLDLYNVYYLHEDENYIPTPVPYYECDDDDMQWIE
jgi:hypothetical protein